MPNETVKCERCQAEGPLGYCYAPLANVKELGWRVEKPVLCPDCRGKFLILIERFLAKEIP